MIEKCQEWDTDSLIEGVGVDHPVHHDCFVAVVRGGAAKYGQLALIMGLPSIHTQWLTSALDEIERSASWSLPS